MWSTIPVQIYLSSPTMKNKLLKIDLNCRSPLSLRINKMGLSGAKRKKLGVVKLTFDDDNKENPPQVFYLKFNFQNTLTVTKCELNGFNILFSIALVD